MQAVLQRNGRTGSAPVRNAFGAILKELIRCGAAMTPSHSTRKGAKRYRYYVCSSAQKRGWHTCPSKSIPAGEIERFVAERIRCIGRDAYLCRATVAETQRQGEERRAELDVERRALEDEAAMLQDTRIDEQALRSFEPLWESMTQREQGRIVQLLVERIDYDGGRGKVSITFHPSGIRAQEHARQPQEPQP